MNHDKLKKSAWIALSCIGVTLFATLSHYYLLTWSASLPPWEASIQASKELGRASELHELAFFSLTFYLPYAILASIATYLVFKFGVWWVAPLSYLLTQVIMWPHNFYSWGNYVSTLVTTIAIAATLLYCIIALSFKFEVQQK